MSTLPQIPFDQDYEPEAAEEIAKRLTALGIEARAEFMGFGTPVNVQVTDDSYFKFQGWGDTDGWYAGREYLDAAGVYQPDESDEGHIEIPTLAGVTDFDAIAQGIKAALQAKYPD